MKTLFFCLILFQLSAQELNVYQASQHFQCYSSVKDHDIVSELLSIAEDFYSLLNLVFHEDINITIEINLFPDLDSHHQAIGIEDAPSWVVARSNDRKIDIVSPLNPGPVHTGESLKKIFLLSISQIYISNAFGNDIPYWLLYGVAAKRVNYFSKRLSSPPPTLQDLETDDYQTFVDIGGFACGYSLAAYIESKYGFEKVIDLLKDYSSFEEILGISKDQLYQEWQELFWHSTEQFGLFLGSRGCPVPERSRTNFSRE